MARRSIAAIGYISSKGVKRFYDGSGRVCSGEDFEGVLHPAEWLDRMLERQQKRTRRIFVRYVFNSLSEFLDHAANK